MGESKSQPLELGLKNGYDSSKRKSTAERTIETDLRHSALVVRRPFLPYSYFYTSQSDRRRVMRVITDAKYEMAKMLVSVKSGGAATGIGSE